MDRRAGPGRRPARPGWATGPAHPYLHPVRPHETTTVDWTRWTTPDGLVDDLTSRSHIITLPDDERARLVAEVRDLLATHPDTAGRAELSMPWQTHCVRAELRTPAG